MSPTIACTGRIGHRAPGLARARWFARTLLALAVLVTGALAAPPARAETTGPTPPEAQCLTQGQVLVLVVDETGKQLALKCADRPTSGEDALTKSGVPFTKTPGQPMICTISSVPRTCPTKFDGRYWSYWTGVPGKPWTFATKGPAETKPAAGTVEGWCHTLKGDEASQQKACDGFLNAVVNTQQLDLTATPSATPTAAGSSTATSGADASTTPAPMPADQDSGTSPIAWLLVGAVSVGAIGYALWLSLKKKNQKNTR